MLGRNSQSAADERRAAEERQHNRNVESQAFQAAASKASKTQAITENANFLAELRKAGVDSDQFHFIENELGPELADAHVIGNRGEEYEREVKWGALGKAMQHLAERKRGRHCQDARDIAIAENLTDRPDKSPQLPFTADERRAIRSGYEAAANYQSLAVEGRGGEMVGETTVTARREVREAKDSVKEKAGGLLD